MTHYAAKMASLITEQRPVIIGLSLGGVIAVEIGKLIPFAKMILIASARNYKELPFYYRLIGRSRSHHLVPDSLLSHANAISYWLFGVQKKEEKELLARILEETDKDFRDRAINALLCWRSVNVLDNVIANHGDRDRIIPIRNIRPDFVVKGGGHFMTVSHAAMIGQLLQNSLNS